MTNLTDLEFYAPEPHEVIRAGRIFDMVGKRICPVVDVSHYGDLHLRELQESLAEVVDLRTPGGDELIKREAELKGRIGTVIIRTEAERGNQVTGEIDSETEEADPVAAPWHRLSIEGPLTIATSAEDANFRQTIAFETDAGKEYGSGVARNPEDVHAEYRLELPDIPAVSIEGTGLPRRDTIQIIPKQSGLFVADVHRSIGYSKASLLEAFGAAIEVAKTVDPALFRTTD